MAEPQEHTATYKVPEVAPQLRCGPRAGYRLIQEGSFPHIRLGRNLLVPKAAFHRWLNQSRREGRREGGKVSA
jgi:excisionase family DNA binding protein